MTEISYLKKDVSNQKCYDNYQEIYFKRAVYMLGKETCGQM